MCVAAIFRNEDLIESRECIRKDGVEGEIISENLARIKRMTAVSLSLNEETLLGQGILANIESG